MHVKIWKHGRLGKIQYGSGNKRVHFVWYFDACKRGGKLGRRVIIQYELGNRRVHSVWLG